MGGKAGEYMVLCQSECRSSDSCIFLPHCAGRIIFVCLSNWLGILCLFFNVCLYVSVFASKSMLNQLYTHIKKNKVLPKGN